MGETRVFYPNFIWTALKGILPYLGVTLGVAFATLLISLFFGGVLAWQKIRGGFGKLMADLYTGLFRCIPTIVVLFLIYYGLPKLLKDLFGVDINFWNRAFFVITAFSLIFTATMSEILRAAYLSVDHVQTEAGLSVGLSHWQTFWRIVFPQAVTFALPNLATAFTALIKEGALAYTIGLIDMMGAGRDLISMNYGSYSIETYLALFLVYWILTRIIEIASARLDRVLGRGRKAIGKP